MATETVAVYPTIPYHQEPRTNYDLQSKTSREKCFYERFDVNGKIDENDESDNTDSHNDNEVCNDHGDNGENNKQSRTSSEKKKRNARKRNRCDMSPEELQRLRERERKAQQNRRDRIRAQKRQTHGWNHDDAAWEAFIDQTDNSNDSSSNRKVSAKKPTTLPSMVCDISPLKQQAEDILSKLRKTDDTPCGMISVDKKHERDDVKYETKQDEKDKYEGKLSKETYERYHPYHLQQRRHNNEGRQSPKLLLTNKEYEKLHQRENRIQREQKVEEKRPSTNEHYRSHLFQEEQAEKYRKEIHAHFSPTRGHTTPPFSYHRHQKLPSPHHAPPHGLFQYPVVYMPPDAVLPHHYSPSDHYYHERRHFSGPYHSRHAASDHRLLKDDAISDQHAHLSYSDYHKSHLSPHSFQPIHEPPVSSSSPRDEKAKLDKHETSENDDSPTEKKRSISRNVDRKKLTEEELEELRRRERDYQRERRARIRLEKAKSQASHDHFQQRIRDDTLMPFYHPSLYHPHPGRDKLPHHMLNRYETMEESEFHSRASSPLPVKPDIKNYRDKTPDIDVEKIEVLENKLDESLDKSKITELLEVVPKTRECEEKTKDDCKTTASKKSTLETICSSLKKESPDWNKSATSTDLDDTCYYDDEDDEKLVIVQPNKDNEMAIDELSMDDIKTEDSDEETHKKDLSKKEKEPFNRDRITEDQLERRRRSNREAQRRRRARLKMLCNSDDKQHHDIQDVLNNSHEINGVEPEKQTNGVPAKPLTENGQHSLSPKLCSRVQNAPTRPDSLYDEHKFRHYINNRDPFEQYFGHSKYHNYNSKNLYDFRDKYFYFPHSYYALPTASEVDDLHHRQFTSPDALRERYIRDKEREDFLKYHNHRLHSPRPRHHLTHRFPDISERRTCRTSMEDCREENERLNEEQLEIDEKLNKDSSSCSPTATKTPDEESCDNEPVKINGRKRKQCVPRKVVTSATNSPEVDVCSISVSPKALDSDMVSPLSLDPASVEE